MYLSKALQRALLPVVPFTLILMGGEVFGVTFANATFDPGKIDSGIPGFVGPDGLGTVSSNNTMNPLFVDWATGFQNYLPAPGVLDQWQTPERALGPVSGVFDDIVSLGELTAEQIAAEAAPGEITLTFNSPLQNGEGPDFAVFENGFGFADMGTLFAELAYVEVSTDGAHFLRFPSTSLTPAPVAPFGQLNPTQVYNLAGKHVNNGVVLPDDEFVPTSWGTPFDLAVLSELANTQSGLVDLNDINFVRIVDIPGNGAFMDTAGRPIYDSWPTPIPGSGGFDLEAVGVINVRSVPESSTVLGLMLFSLLGLWVRWSQRLVKSQRRWPFQSE